MKGVKIDAKPAPFLAPAFKSRIADVPTGCELALIEMNDFHLVSLQISWQESMTSLRSDGGVRFARDGMRFYHTPSEILRSRVRHAVGIVPKSLTLD